MLSGINGDNIDVTLKQAGEKQIRMRVEVPSKDNVEEFDKEMFLDRSFTNENPNDIVIKEARKTVKAYDSDTDVNCSYEKFSKKTKDF